MTPEEENSRQALINSTLALDRIARHEEECGKRWAMVVKLLSLGVAQLWGLLVFLLAERMEWLS